MLYREVNEWLMSGWWENDARMKYRLYILL